MNDASPAAIAAARADGETIASISRRTGLSPTTVQRRGCRGGFVPKRRDYWKIYDPILMRLLAALDTEMKVVEARITANGETSRMDSERDARTLNGLARLYDRLSELASRVAGRQEKTQAAVADDETVRLRRELAERLKRLRGPEG